MEHKIGSMVEMDLPASRGGRQKLRVVQNSSCIGCAFSGLGHSHCPNIKCGREERSDGHSVHFEKVVDDE